MEAATRYCVYPEVFNDLLAVVDVDLHDEIRQWKTKALSTGLTDSEWGQFAFNVRMNLVRNVEAWAKLREKYNLGECHKGPGVNALVDNLTSNWGVLMIRPTINTRWEDRHGVQE